MALKPLTQVRTRHCIISTLVIIRLSLSTSICFSIAKDKADDRPEHVASRLYDNRIRPGDFLDGIVTPDMLKEAGLLPVEGNRLISQRKPSASQAQAKREQQRGSSESVFMHTFALSHVKRC